jgi:hypothetical protein
MLMGGIVGGLTGAASGAADGALGAVEEGDIVEKAIEGAKDGLITGFFVGAVVGPLSAVKAIQPVLVGLGIVGTIVGAADSIRNENYYQLIFRVTPQMLALPYVMQKVRKAAGWMRLFGGGARAGGAASSGADGVTLGGNITDPNMFSGHGAEVPGSFVTPQDITFHVKPGKLLKDVHGGLIETGQPLPHNMYEYTYPKGSVVPEHLLSPPTNPDLNILGNPTTVSEPTLLSTLMKTATGPCHWAACREHLGEDLGWHIGQK